MIPIGALSGRVTRLDVPGRRAVVFSGATRNSLVVVTQTLVELLVMVVFVRLIPRLIPNRHPAVAAA